MGARASYTVQCQHKHRYTSMSLARKVARKARNGSDEVITPYYCRYCNGFHIGSNQQFQSWKRPLPARGEGEDA